MHMNYNKYPVNLPNSPFNCMYRKQHVDDYNKNHCDSIIVLEVL